MKRAWRSDKEPAQAAVWPERDDKPSAEREHFPLCERLVALPYPRLHKMRSFSYDQHFAGLLKNMALALSLEDRGSSLFIE